MTAEGYIKSQLVKRQLDRSVIGSYADVIAEMLREFANFQCCQQRSDCSEVFSDAYCNGDKPGDVIDKIKQTPVPKF